MAGPMYKLNIKMNKDDLMLLNSIDKKVVLVKENSESSGNSNGFIDEVAWVTFQLWGDNKVTWKNEYSVYASENSQLATNSIENNYYKPEISEITQSVKVGEKLYEANPINAMTVSNDEQAYFIPIEKIKVFLAARAENGKVISVAQSQALLLDFTEKPETTITYDRNTSKFVIKK